MKVKNVPENHKMMAHHPQPSKVEMIKDNDVMPVVPNTIVKQSRFQKLMKILKKIKHKRRLPVKTTQKQMSPKEDKSKNYRIVNPDGSIKWGYHTSSGLFKVHSIVSYQRISFCNNKTISGGNYRSGLCHERSVEVYTQIVLWK